MNVSPGRNSFFSSSGPERLEDKIKLLAAQLYAVGEALETVTAEKEQLAAALLPFADAYIKAMPDKYPQGWLTTIGNWLELEHFEAAAECFPDLPPSPYSAGERKVKG